MATHHPANGADSTRETELEVDDSTDDSMDFDAAPERSHRSDSGLPPVIPALPREVSSPQRATLQEVIVADIHAAIAQWEAELERDGDPSTTARYHFEIARHYEYPLRKLGPAKDHYLLAQRLLPDYLPAIRGARRVLCQLGDHLAAIPFFDAEFKLLPDPAHRAALLFSKGRVLEDHLGQRHEARKAYARALELARNDASILKAVERMELADKEWAPLAQTYERTANTIQADTRHRSALNVLLGRLAENRQQNTPLAIDAYETALELDARCLAALAALKRLYHSKGRWQDLITLLVRESELTRNEAYAGSLHAQIALLYRQRLNDKVTALSALEQAVIRRGKDVVLLGRLADWYRDAGRFAEEREILQRLVTINEDPRHCLNYLHRIGRISETELADDAEAIKWYEVALQFSATDLPIIDALSRLYVQHQQWESLIRLHENEALSVKEGERQVTALLRIAEIYDRRLQRRQEAVTAYEKVLAISPQNAAAFTGLVRLHREMKNYHALIEVYQRGIDATTSSDRVIAYLFAVGLVYEELLDDHLSAMHCYSRIVELDRDNLGAIHAFQRAAERAGRYREQVAALELEAEKSDDPERVVSLLHHAGEILLQQAGDLDGALLLLRKVIQLNPAFQPALRSLGRLYYAAGRWEDLLAVYQQQLKLLPGGRDAVDMLLKIGELCEERIGRESDALHYYRQAVDLDATYEPALNNLVDSLERHGDWAGLIDALRQQANNATRPELRQVILLRVAQLFEEKLRRIDDAVSVYSEAAALASEPGIVDALLRCRSEQRNWKGVAEALTDELKGAADPLRRESALLQLGALCSDHLNQVGKAIGYYRQVLDTLPEHLACLLSLEPLYAEADDWESLADLYYRQATVLTDRGARLASLRELARLQELKGVGDKRQLRETFELIGKLRRDDVHALEALERLALREGDHRLLAEIDQRLAELTHDVTVKSAHVARSGEALELIEDETAAAAYGAALVLDAKSLAATRGLTRIADRGDDPRQLATALRCEAENTRLPTRAAELLTRSAELRLDHLDDANGAMLDLKRALELNPDNVRAVTRLHGLLVERSAFAPLADLLSQAAKRCKSADRRAYLWMMVADIYAGDMGNINAATTAIQRILAQEPDHLSAQIRMAELYEAGQQWRPAVETLKRVLELAEAAPMIVACQLKLAGIYEQRLNDRQNAIATLEAVLGVDSADRRALAQLAALKLASDPAASAALARRLVRSTRSPSDRANALVQLFRAETALGRETIAIDTLREAVGLDGPHSLAGDELERLTQRSGKWELFATALGEYLDFVEESGRPTPAAYVKLASIQAERLDKPRQALTTLERGLRLCGPQNPLLGLKAAIHNQLGDWDGALRTCLDAIGHDVTNERVWFECVTVFEHQKRFEEAELARSALALLDSDQVSSTGPNLVGLRPRSLSKDDMGELGPPEGVNREATGLLDALQEALPKLYPFDPARYGVSSRDRIPQNTLHPLRLLLDQLSPVFGADDLELYVVPDNLQRALIYPTQPGVLLLPKSGVERGQSAQVFLIAEALANRLQGFHLAGLLQPTQLERLLVAAVRTAEPQFAPQLGFEPELGQLSKLITRHLSRRGRRVLEDAAIALAQRGLPDTHGWTQCQHLTAIRVAAVIANDLTAVVELLCDAPLGQLRSRLGKLPLPVDLLRFWLSRPALALRRRIGLLR